VADKATVLQNAQRFMAKGQVDKAIDEWQKLISESPNDGNIYNTIGDLLLKKNDLSRAVDAYLKGAEVFHQAGFALKTIAIYKKLIKLVPQRFEILIKLGDLNAERGLTGNAIEDYLTAAKQYSQKGNIREALEVYRKIANLDPSNTVNRMKLADLCLKEGLQEEAVDEFVKVAEAYVGLGQVKEAESLAGRILKLDPQNEAVRQILGKPSAPSGTPSKKPASATPENLMAKIDDAVEKDDLELAQKLLAQFSEQNPNDPIGHHKIGMALLKRGKKEDAFELCKTAAERYMSRNEFGHAGKMMNEYVEANPDRSDARLLLGEIHEKGGNAHLAVSAYALVIDDFLASGETAQARSLYAKIKTLEPGHRDVRRLRHSFETSESSESSLSIEPLESKSISAGASSFVAPAEQEVPVSVPEKTPSDIPLETAQNLNSTSPVVDTAALNSLLTEAEVYLKYGLASKAVEQIRQALAMDPENEQAHLQLKDIYKSEHETEKAVEECFFLMEIYKRTGDGERRSAILEEARQMAPEHPRIREATDLAPILESGRMKAILDTEQDEVPADPPAAQGHTAEQELVGKEETKAESDSESALPADDLGEQTAEADFYYQQGLRDEAKKMYGLILTQQPDNPSALQGLETIAKDEAVDRKEEAQKSRAEEAASIEEAPVERARPTPAASKSSKPSGPSKPRSADEEMLDDELEKSFAPFMGGDPNEGAETGRAETGKAPKPSNKAVDPAPAVSAEKAQEKGRRSKDHVSKTPGNKKEEFVDLSGMINEPVKDKVKRISPEFSSDEKSINEELDSIFSEFQKDAQEQIDDIDYETHYNLGIAYKEMGLINEAMIEFKQAMKGPDRFIDASNMLAACYRESGNDREAIGILESALTDSQCDETQARWLRYDLASLYETEDRTAEALSLFKEVARSDRNFKDVTQRIENLEQNLGGSKRKKTPAKEAAAEDEDVDAMMERVFGETSSAPQAGNGQGGSHEPSTERSTKKDRISYL
jgi:tetratricopeptide (TPR) repeat protein